MNHVRRLNLNGCNCILVYFNTFLQSLEERHVWPDSWQMQIFFGEFFGHNTSVKVKHWLAGRFCNWQCFLKFDFGAVTLHVGCYDIIVPTVESECQDCSDKGMVTTYLYEWWLYILTTINTTQHIISDHTSVDRGVFPQLSCVRVK